MKESEYDKILDRINEIKWMLKHNDLKIEEGLELGIELTKLSDNLLYQ